MKNQQTCIFLKGSPGISILLITFKRASRSLLTQVYVGTMLDLCWLHVGLCWLHVGLSWVKLAYVGSMLLTLSQLEVNLGHLEATQSHLEST